MWKHPTPELPTQFDRYEYQAKRCKGAGWHPSLLLYPAQVERLNDALSSEDGKAWLEAKGERQAALSKALLYAFMRHSLEDPRYYLALPRPTPRFTPRARESSHDYYERRAAEWNAAKRPWTTELEGEELATLMNWVTSQGAERDGVSDLLRTYLEQSKAGYPDLAWYHFFLMSYSHCSSCGWSLRIEDLLLCTHCTRYYCRPCMEARGKKAPNGNFACPDGRGELVG